MRDFFCGCSSSSSSSSETETWEEWVRSVWGSRALGMRCRGMGQSVLRGRSLTPQLACLLAPRADLLNFLYTLGWNKHTHTHTHNYTPVIFTDFNNFGYLWPETDSGFHCKSSRTHRNISAHRRNFMYCLDLSHKTRDVRHINICTLR